MNVLITSASRKVSLVQAFQQALIQEEVNGQVIAVDANPRSAALYFANKSYVVPSGPGESFLGAIQGICQKHDVKLLIPTRDEELPVFAAAKDALQSIGVTVIVSDLDVVRICQDKRSFIEFCLKNGFFVPKTYMITETNVVSEFPLFLKERFGKGSKGTFLAKSGQDLNYLLQHLKEPIIQEYVDAREYTVDLFSDFSGEVISVVPRERLTTFGGESSVGRTCKNWDIMREAVRLAKQLRLVGHNTIQCFLHEGKIKFIEVNPRYGGGATLGFAAGAFTPGYLVRLLLGKEVKPMIGDFEDGYLMLRYTKDIFLSEQEVSRLEHFN